MESPAGKFNKNYSGIVVLIAVVAVAAYYLGASNKEVQVATPSIRTALPQVQTNVSSGNIYDYTEASNHIGEYASIRGQVVKVYRSNKNTTFFDYCENYKSCPFGAVIFSSNLYKFNDPLQYQGRIITIRGNIKSYQGRAEIILDDSSQIIE